jgi:uncharacterized protein YdeI (YjbR/CyaY-like superfamily)
MIQSISFEKELRELLNKHSVENQSNTPDFVLCGYIEDCLTAFNNATKRRDNYYGVVQSPEYDQTAREKQWVIPSTNANE